MDPLRRDDPRQVGPYPLEGRLGAGGMGEVFLGASPSGRKVAVKVVRAQYAADPAFRLRFAREIEAARKVGGFHTAQVVDADPEAVSPWMVTAFVPGPSLRQVVRGQGPLAPHAVRELGRGLAEGLAAIHACGLVHRDLKPGNVIMAPDGPRIIDFGIARSTDATALTSTGAVVGTFSFMSPEQVRADVTGPASDVFSLGCVLAYAALGRGPFDAATIPAIVHKIVGAPPDLAGLTADPHLHDLIAGCLEKAPERRPTVQDVLTGLTAGPPGRPGRSRGPSRRAVLLGGAAVAATAAVTVPAVLLWPSDAPAARRRNAPKTPIGTPTAVTLPSSEVAVSDLVFSADGRTLWGAGFSSILRWDLSTAQVVSRKTSDTKTYRRPMVFSPDGKTLATGGEAGGVHLWDVASGRVRKSFAKARNVEMLAFSPDGRSLAVSDGNGPQYVQIWDTVTDKSVSMKTDYYADVLAFSPDGGTLAGVRGLSGRFTFWDVSTGKGAENSAESASEIPSLAFSPDGKTIAVSNGTYWAIELRSTSDGSLDTTLKGVDGAVQALAFSPDGDTLVSADEKNVRLWHVPTRRNTATLPGDADDDQVVVFAPHGQSFATTGGSGTTRLWTFA
ncbi:WD40 repeat domain-containing serine/threonine protein kinase [Actinomadura xylanilytica]|uniref:WD40 repeat domain-containing serine/threonine protein kinase n=1 Tax=Actinomadura xylanilytica TaxID=887459 RepID=UPI00255AA34C|nr:serine/threonine-protein kinase [Actinomadura xylanilytica]MDL4773912.1 serine/threonine-protein kinase [Actinomadura xylanilytica]